MSTDKKKYKIEEKNDKRPVYTKLRYNGHLIMPLSSEYTLTLYRVQIEIQ